MTLILPTFDDVAKASDILKGVAHRTPVLTSRTVDSQTGAKIFFKAENFQRMGAFKFRGGYNAIASLTDEQRAKGVLAYSSGNHAQAIALSGQLLGVKTVILMPEDAPAAKKAATEGYGATVVTYDRYTQSREELAHQMQEETGMTVVPPYDHFHVIAGQGTAAKELIEDVGDLDYLLVCVGGGGLLAGCALAAKGLSPNCQVFGVEPEAGNDGQQSFRKGEVVTISTPRSIADGALTNYLGQLTFAIIKDKVTDMLTVTDAQLIQTMKFFGERMKMVVEPTGCLAAAAVMHGALKVPVGSKVGVILSGGNVDLNAYAGFLSQTA